MFAIWMTGLPASGKSTITRWVSRLLRTRGLDPEVLESDAMRAVLTPHPTYSEAERSHFYRVMTFVGETLVRHGVPVIFDATANLRAYRAHAHEVVPRLLEVFVDCPLEVCRERDGKGLYARAEAGALTSLPGPQAPYEPPEHPDVHVHSDRERPEAAARRIIETLAQRGFLDGAQPGEPTAPLDVPAGC